MCRKPRVKVSTPDLNKGETSAEPSPFKRRKQQTLQTLQTLQLGMWKGHTWSIRMGPSYLYPVSDMGQRRFPIEKRNTFLQNLSHLESRGRISAFFSRSVRVQGYASHMSRLCFTLYTREPCPLSGGKAWNSPIRPCPAIFFQPVSGEMLERGTLGHREKGRQGLRQKQVPRFGGWSSEGKLWKQGKGR